MPNPQPGGSWFFCRDFPSLRSADPRQQSVTLISNPGDAPLLRVIPAGVCFVLHLILYRRMRIRSRVKKSLHEKFKNLCLLWTYLISELRYLTFKGMYCKSFPYNQYWCCLSISWSDTFHWARKMRGVPISSTSLLYLPYIRTERVPISGVGVVQYWYWIQYCQNSDLVSLVK